MKLLFFTHYYPPEGNAPASRVHAMARRWVAAGHEVTVVTCAPNVPNGIAYAGYRNHWCMHEEMEGVHVVRVWSLLAPNKGVVKRILSFLTYQLSAMWQSRRLGRPDLVLATSPQFFCAWAGVWVARFKQRPLILEIRDIWPESIAAVGALGRNDQSRKKGLVIRGLECLERRMYRAAKIIVTVGQGYRQRLLERGVLGKKIHVVTNGVETAMYQPMPADNKLRSEAQAGEDDFLIGYIGTVGMAHGLEVIIATGRLARDRGLQGIRFVVVGDGARRTALEVILSEDDPGNIIFVGRRPKDEMPKWLASVDACLIHLRSSDLFTTVLPSKIFEAAAMKRPIILGVKGDAQRVVEASGGGVCIEPENSEQLLQSIVKIMSFSDKGKMMGESGREYVLKHYDLDVLAQDYESILQTVIAEGCVV